ncbi:MAG: baseplate J/gp47 family protein [Flavobacteriales bacterium]|nr:baseplate J/gp47 family protein [Flavobacteriales bacterium]
MIEKCENIVTLERDRTSQQQRLLKALLPSYVSVDERSMQDLIDFTNRLTKEINYYNNNNQVDGDWESFFANQVIDETNQKTQPHYALFIAFLELFKYAQEDLNTITQRHLDFYYKDVLQIKEREAVPDQVFVIFELARQVSSHLVDAGTALNAGKDATGVNLVYDTEKNLVVNKALTTNFKALFYNKDNDGRLYASPIANSANGEGEPIETEEPKWRTFGSVSTPTASYLDADRPQAQVGFAFASPLLRMAEGNRSVSIVLTVENLFGLTTAELNNAFKVLFSGEEGWIEPLNTTTKAPLDTTYVSGGNTITIVRTLTEGQEAIVPYNQEVLLEPFDTTSPVTKIVLNTDDSASPYVYEKLKNLIIQKATIQVNVDGVKNLIVQNDQSKFDASKPFMPFGNKPLLTSSFYIGSQEVFSKQLSSLDLNITWKGLPDDPRGFLDYYEYYMGSDNVLRRNGQFRAEISILEGREWKTLVPENNINSRLFDPATNTQLNDFRLITINNSALSNVPADPELGEISKYDNSSNRGFVRMQLAHIDFGHNDYQVSFATQAIKASQNTPEEYPLPNEPYTPLISEISLNYVSSDSLDLISSPATDNEEAFKLRKSQFFHVEPFGIAEEHPFISETTPDITLIPLYNNEGTLYIGVENLVPPQTLSVLFKVAEGSANPDLPQQTVNWSYLSGNEWYDFANADILSDSTNGLITSGIIEFNVPKNASSNNTLLPSDFHWIRATVGNNSGAICEMISIQAQAALARFEDNGNDPTHLAQSLSADSISGLVNSNSAIKGVTQPYASFGGREKEDSDSFYARVSERLRHKNRAIMIWDYEHLVLEAFPKIFKVKCLNHTRYISVDDINEISPGHVSLVIVSNLQNKNAVNPLQPKTSLATLSEIQSFIKDINPPCAELFVKNPLYEEIVVHFKVRLLPGYDPGFYLHLINENIKEFLAPWAFESNKIVVFGGRIHASVIVNFIEELDYVDYVSCFTMDQITASGVKKDIQEAVASTSASILTSVTQHDIHLLETDDCECNDNVVQRPSADNECGCDETNSGSDSNQSNVGVGSGAVGDDFIVGNGEPFGNNGIGNMSVDGDFEVQ